MSKTEQFKKLAILRKQTVNYAEKAKILDTMLTLGSYDQLFKLRRYSSSDKDRAKILITMITLGSYQQLVNLRKYISNYKDRAKILEAMLSRGSYEQLVNLRKHTSGHSDRAKILDSMLEKTKVKKPVFISQGNNEMKKEISYVNSSLVKQYDVFICHASEDKDFATPLADSLRKAGINVWYDDFVLKLGDSLQREIDRGLANSKYGIVILSHYFFNKNWPQRELDGLVAKGGSGNILPIWKGLSEHEILSYSPTLAGIIGTNTRMGIQSVTKQIKDIVQR